MTTPDPHRARVRRTAVTVAVVAIATSFGSPAVAQDEPPPSLPPAPAGWHAELTLACADDPTMRTVESFEAERSPTVLYLGRPQAGGWSMERTVEVGDVVPPAEGTEWVFFWQVPGVLLGPYPVAEVTDTCGALPTSGPSDDPWLLALLGCGLVLAGGAMVVVARRR